MSEGKMRFWWRGIMPLKQVRSWTPGCWIRVGVSQSAPARRLGVDLGTLFR
jgi:hypothetical protein